MKFSLRLGNKGNLTREEAWACCSTNLVLPGGGSLLAGRKIGYPQVVLCLTGFALTLGFGVKFLAWGWQNFRKLSDPSGDPLDNLLALWHACRWTLLGLGIFAVAWIWALLTNLAILRNVRRPQGAPGAAPPVIPPR